MDKQKINLDSLRIQIELNKELELKARRQYEQMASAKVNPDIAELFLRVSKDEARHAKICDEILEIIDRAMRSSK